MRAPAFVWPHGWRHRYWWHGDILPPLFLTSQFFFDNVGPLGLAPARPGLRWVRFGNDLLLVNVRTGRVEDVAYGVFF